MLKLKKNDIARIFEGHHFLLGYPFGTKFNRKLRLEDIIAVTNHILLIGPFFDTFWGQIPSYKASNLGFNVFVGFFKFVIISYLLVYATN